MVGKVGNNLDISRFYGYNIDLSGVKKVEIPTTEFYTYWNSEDGQDRSVSGDVESIMEVGSQDIPQEFLGAKHFHLTTATPEKQMELITFIREHTNATISVDTIDQFATQKLTRQVFDNVDIAFIDKEYKDYWHAKQKQKL